uniref:E3 ubiquitin-protein ligase HUWE1-like n=1 Tax=Callorhinchus milii TaxID=7868 RepID=A0A4W3GJG5_CALMI
MELDEDYPDIDESLVRFDREDDLIIEFDNMFSTAADIPPAPGNIPATHPLMVRHADHSALTLGTGSSTTRLTQGIGRSQRAIRPFAANTGHTIHVHYPGNRQPNPPLILQRLVLNPPPLPFSPPLSQTPSHMLTLSVSLTHSLFLSLIHSLPVSL